ncbi:MAG: hypothetical protein ACJAUD_001179 [Crocinitomicaceae bacterium]|jgi:hypothetical protein
MNERGIDIVEEYLSARISKNPIPNKQIQQRIKRTRVPEEIVDDILLEMEDEWDREQLNQFAFKKAKMRMITGSLGSLSIFIIIIASILFNLMPERIIIVPYVLMAYGFLISFQGYFQIRKSKMVKERREIKWRIYDKYQSPISNK